MGFRLDSAGETMARRIRHRTTRGTNNRYDGRLDYELPPPWTVNNIVNYSSTEDILATLSDSATAVPLQILNQGSPGEGRNDDDDGNPYDIIFWEVDGDSDFGFAQDIYRLREPAPGTSIIENIPIVLGSPIKAVAIIIEDFQSLPVRQASAASQPIAETQADDFALYSTPNDDQLFGLEGNDNLFAGAGNDLVDGGSGLDRLVGSSGDDQIYGEADNDLLYGSTGVDILFGGSGDDGLYGGSENDTIYGGTGDDRIDGDTGVDTLNGGFGNDIYNLKLDASDVIVEFAGQGTDTIRSFFNYTLPDQIERLILVGEAATIGTGNALDNVITTEDIAVIVDPVPEVNHTLLGGEGNDLIQAGSGNDLIDGQAGNDRLAGWYGTDTLTGGTGADEFVFATNYSSYFAGYDGIDVITDFNVDQGDRLIIPLNGFGTGGLVVGNLPASQFFSGGSATTAAHRFIYNPATGGLFYDRDGLGGNLQQQIAQLPTGLTLAHTAIRVEEGFAIPGLSAATGGVGGKAFAGTPAPDRLFGDENNDAINGLAGEDQISGQEGNDVLNGGSGKDFLVGGSGNDTAIGESEDDLLYGELGDDVLSGDAGNDTLTGGLGNDRLLGGLGRDRFNFYQPNGADIDELTDFNTTDDQIGLYVGTTLTDSFAAAGFALNQPLAAAQFQVGSGAIESDDRIIYNNLTGALLFDVDGTGAMTAIQIATLPIGISLTANQFIAFDQTNVTAPPSPPSPIGTPGNDVINGGDANDSLSGSEGDDILSGNNGNDLLRGGKGNDLLRGGGNKDVLIGLGGNDRLSGGVGSDRLDGGLGDDRLYGGRGNDTLKGGPGRDIFVLEPGRGRDRIEDFRNGSDRLGLAPGLKFSQLEIVQRSQGTLIRAGRDDLAVLLGVSVQQISQADFVKVPLL